MQPQSPQDHTVPQDSSIQLAVDRFLQQVEAAVSSDVSDFLVAWSAAWCDIGQVRFAAVCWRPAELTERVISAGEKEQSVPEWLDHDEWWVKLLQYCRNGDSLIIHPETQHELQVLAAAEHLLLIRPIMYNGLVEAISVIVVDPDHTHEQLAWIWDSSIAVAEEYAKSRQYQQTTDELQHSREFESILSRLYTIQDTRAVARYAVHAATLWVPCDQLVVVHRTRHRWRLLAVTGIEKLDQRGDLSMATVRLAQASSVYGKAAGSHSHELPSQFEEPLQHWIDNSHVQHVVVVPCPGPFNDDEDSVTVDDCRTVLIAGCFLNELSAPEAERVERLAGHLGQAIEVAHRNETQPLSKASRRLAKLFDRRRWLGRLTRLALLMTLVIIGIGVLLMPVPFTVQAVGEIQPRQRQIVFAPTDGVVEVVHVSHGDYVTINQEMIEVKRNALQFDLAKLEGQRSNLTTQLDNLTKSSLGIVSARDGEGDDADRNAAERRRIEIELEGLNRQIAIARDETQHLVVRAPFDGVVLTRHPNRDLDGRPVSVGDQLLVVADLHGDWELELDCAEEDIRHIREADGECRLQFTTAARPNEKWPARLTELERVAHTSPIGQTAIRLRATVLTNQQQDDIDEPSWTPGVSVSARIYLGKRSLGYVLTRRAWNTLRYQFFF
ncbi:MAG TPA: efflux RND transporter periplasmic adaptor subunit [Planctomycetes bacterium]|nr:efflux RND transporter periplasmic adaptor subunit [Planctomycetota bacterium]